MEITEAIEILEKYKKESEEDYYIKRAEALNIAICILKQIPTDATSNRIRGLEFKAAGKEINKWN